MSKTEILLAALLVASAAYLGSQLASDIERRLIDDTWQF